MREVRVVALNKDAKLIGVFDSITSAAKEMGVSYIALNGRLLKGKPYRRILFVREREYREHWLKGTTDVYKFPTKKEICHNRVVKAWENMSQEKRQSILEKRDKGRDEYNRKHRNKKVICVETGIVYDSIGECARAFNVSRGAIESRLRRGSTVNGSTFKFYEDGNQ